MAATGCVVGGTIGYIFKTLHKDDAVIIGCAYGTAAFIFVHGFINMLSADSCPNEIPM